MQVFLPYENYKDSAEVLDPRRRNKQILECVQIAKAILGMSESWRNHCVTRMWDACPKGLVLFGLELCKIYKFENRKHHKSKNELTKLLHYCCQNGYDNNYPKWLGIPKIHMYYQQHLKSKDELFYNFFDVEPISGYWALNKHYEWQLYSVK